MSTPEHEPEPAREVGPDDEMTEGELLMWNHGIRPVR